MTRLSWRRVALALLGVLILSGCAAQLPEPVLEAASPAEDADSDGVVDAADLCANTPGPQPVSETGCPVFLGVLEGVEFEAAAADLGRNARLALDRLVEELNDHPEVIITVDGHTDNRGSGAQNLELSKQRVLSVVRYLVARGVAPQRLRPYGYGEARPIVSNSSPEGRRQNRRIEISVVAEG